MKGDTDIGQVVATQGIASQGLQHHGPMQCGPVCQPSEPPTGKVHHFETPQLTPL